MKKQKQVQIKQIAKPKMVRASFNWWYAGMYSLASLSLLGGALYAVTRNVIGVLFLLVFAGLAFLCYWRASKNIPSVPTLTSEAPTMGKANVLCIYGSKDTYDIRRAVKIQFETRKIAEEIQDEIAKIIETGGSLTRAEEIEVLKVELKKAIPAEVMNSDRWYVEDISQWLPVIYQNLDDCDDKGVGRWVPLELPDAKYTDPARMEMPINRSAYQKFHMLDASMFEKLKPLIMVGANALVLFFLFLATNKPGGT